MVSVQTQGQSIFPQQAIDQAFSMSSQDPMMDQNAYGADGMPLLQEPTRGAVLANADQSFLKWLFSFTNDSLEPLKNNWMGRELNDKGEWVYPNGKPNPNNVLMSESGIMWCITLLKSYFSPVFFVTSMDERNYNHRMRTISKTIFYNLFERYKEFGLKTSDIPRIAEELESKIAAILAGALRDGYRIFLSTQNQNIEHKMLSGPIQGTTSGGSVFSKMSDSLFKKEGGGRQYG